LKKFVVRTFCRSPLQTWCFAFCRC